MAPPNRPRTGWRQQSWDLGPIDQFKDAYQDDLARFFEAAGARPVSFGIGYRWHPKRTNILVAEKN